MEEENRRRNEKLRLKLKAEWLEYEKERKPDKAEEAPPSHLLLTHTFRVTFILSLYSGSIWHLPLRSEPWCAKRESRPCAHELKIQTDKRESRARDLTSLAWSSHEP